MLNEVFVPSEESSDRPVSRGEIADLLRESSDPVSHAYANGFTFEKNFGRLLKLGVRKDIATQLAGYAAFNGEDFDEDGCYLVRVFEEIGQEPEVNGRMAA